jgi:hypothetical protein
MLIAQLPDELEMLLKDDGLSVVAACYVASEHFLSLTIVSADPCPGDPRLSP